MAALLKLQSGVIVSQQVVIALGFINAVNTLGLTIDQLVTSGNDKVHARGSKHYSNDALDFRTKHLPKGIKAELVAMVKRRLGRDYDVILEAEGGVNEHLHVEYDPK